MLQNKGVLIFLWLLIFLFIGFLFLGNDDSKEKDAVLKSTELLRSYDKELFDNTQYKIEKDVLDYGSDPRDRKVLDRFKENRAFLDSLDKTEKLDWSILLTQLVQSPKDSTYSNSMKDLDSLLYSYSKSDSKPIFSIHQNLLYHYYMISLNNDRNRFGGFHPTRFGDYLQIYTLDYTIALHTSTPIYTNFIIEPHFDKPKYHSINFIFNKDSVIRFQAITEFIVDGEKTTQTKRYEIVPENGKIMNPLSYKEIE